MNLPKIANEATIQALLLKVRAGNKEACQQMVLEHMLLAKLKVQDFLNDYPQLQHELDDLVSVAVTAVVDAVNRVKTGAMREHNNITGYVRVTIWRHLGDWITNRTVARNFFRQLAPAVSSANEEVYWAGDENSIGLEDEGDWTAIEDDHSYMEIMDTLESLALMEEEWFIIESRLVGDTYNEIAQNFTKVFRGCRDENSYHPMFIPGKSPFSEFGERFVLQDILRRYLEKIEETNV
jgi:hypothetical protein